jgi:hypothetical protein
MVPAHADILATELLDRVKKGDVTARYYLRGITEGISWYNTAIGRNDGALFCEPPNLAITQEQYIDIMERYLEANPSLKKMGFAGTILIRALKDTFPCRAR